MQATAPGGEPAHAVVAVLATTTGVGALVVGGVFFAFSAFVMRGLADAGDRSGLAAMQGINRAAVRPPLLVLLFGTLLAGLATCILLAVVGGGHALWWGLAGEVVYLVGVVVVTAAFHVPRNDALARLEGEDGAETATAAAAAAAAAVWRRYVSEWTRGNHVRALAGVVAGVLFGVAAFVVAAPFVTV